MRWRKLTCLVVSVILAWLSVSSFLWAYFLYHMMGGGFILLSEPDPTILWIEFFLAVVGGCYIFGTLVKLIKDTFFPAPVQK